MNSMDGPYLDINGPAGRRQLALNETAVTIGRSAENVVALADNMASRFHCVIEKVPQGFQLRDLKSSNGTLVNGRRVKTSLLQAGDVVKVGKTEFTLITPELDAPSLDDVEGLQGGADAEALSEEDLVEANSASEDYEKVLEVLAESLPDRSFGENDIELINARGKVTHEAAPPPQKRTRREAVDLFRLLLLICARSRATDIHMEAKNDFYQLRLRIDGTMAQVARLPNEFGVRIAALVKILCELDMSQRNIVQEGHFTARVAGRRIDYRVSFAPAVHGQKMVIRVLDASNAPLRVKDLQLPDWMRRDIERAIQQEAGMVLVCGPTGSGKTTSLYALVRSSDINQNNMVTIEDPVEIQIQGVTQLPVDEANGKTFSTLLRSVLRQDPDSILVGEIRDSETARIAMQAAITGHLVFSTLHTKDTVGTIFRLLDLGVEPYLLAQGLHLILAQRLVRQLCPYCKKASTPTADQLSKMGPSGEGVTRLFSPVGCPRCLGTGYAGRRAFFELLSTTEELRDVIVRSPTQTDIQKAVSGLEFISLQQSGHQLVAQGLVAFDEIDRAMGRDPRLGV